MENNRKFINLAYNITILIICSHVLLVYNLQYLYGMVNSKSQEYCENADRSIIE